MPELTRLIKDLEGGAELTPRLVRRAMRYRGYVRIYTREGYLIQSMDELRDEDPPARFELSPRGKAHKHGNLSTK